MARSKAQVTVTYDVITEASAVDGDSADNGFIHPVTEERRSFSNGGKRVTERNMRMARAGKFDWTLRDAIRFIDARCCASHETCWSAAESTMSVYAYGEYQGIDDIGETLNYCLDISGVSDGSLIRLARLLASNGVHFANVRSLRKVG